MMALCPECGYKHAIRLLMRDMTPVVWCLHCNDLFPVNAELPDRDPPDPYSHGIAPELVAEINGILELDAERWNVIEWGEWA